MFEPVAPPPAWPLFAPVLSRSGMEDRVNLQARPDPFPPRSRDRSSVVWAKAGESHRATPWRKRGAASGSSDAHLPRLQPQRARSRPAPRADVRDPRRPGTAFDPPRERRFSPLAAVKFVLWRPAIFLT